MNVHNPKNPAPPRRASKQSVPCKNWQTSILFLQINLRAQSAYLKDKITLQSGPNHFRQDPDNCCTPPTARGGVFLFFGAISNISLCSSHSKAFQSGPTGHVKACKTNNIMYPFGSQVEIEASGTTHRPSGVSSSWVGAGPKS